MFASHQIGAGGTSCFEIVLSFIKDLVITNHDSITLVHKYVAGRSRPLLRRRAASLGVLLTVLQALGSICLHDVEVQRALADALVIVQRI